MAKKEDNRDVFDKALDDGRDPEGNRPHIPVFGILGAVAGGAIGGRALTRSMSKKVPKKYHGVTKFYGSLPGAGTGAIIGLPADVAAYRALHGEWPGEYSKKKRRK